PARYFSSQPAMSIVTPQPCGCWSTETQARYAAASLHMGRRPSSAPAEYLAIATVCGIRPAFLLALLPDSNSRRAATDSRVLRRAEIFFPLRTGRYRFL